ncbi:MAG TPA: MFS transporter [Gammaproteobacteria bacterium]|nr:MFS transporter [Gammaproteobacteria bacterium]
MSSQVDTMAPAYKEDSVAFVALLMCVLGAVFYCYEYYLRVAPSVIQPELMSTFNISQAGLGTLIAYYYLAYVPLQIPVGLMMDYWGPRRVLTFACLLCSLGTYIFASTDVIWIAKIGRFMVGFGSAFAYVGVLKIANLWLPRRYFATVAGLCTALGMFGAISGGLLMAKFINLTGWQFALYSSSLMGVILTIILWAVIRDKSDRETINLGRASHRGRSIWTELLEVIKNKQLWINGIIGCLTFLPLTAFAEFWAVSYLQSHGLSKEAAALGSSIVFLGFALGGPIWGRVSDVIESRRIPLMLGSVGSAAAALFLLNLEAGQMYILYILLFSLGALASAQILVFAVGEDICRPGMTATTVSFTNFLVMLGGMALQPAVGILLDRLQTVNAYGEILITTQHFKSALLIMPIGLILAAVLSLVLKESYNTKG